MPDIRRSILWWKFSLLHAQKLKLYGSNSGWTSQLKGSRNPLNLSLCISVVMLMHILFSAFDIQTRGVKNQAEFGLNFTTQMQLTSIEPDFRKLKLVKQHFVELHSSPKCSHISAAFELTSFRSNFVVLQSRLNCSSISAALEPANFSLNVSVQCFAMFACWCTFVLRLAYRHKV